MTVFTQPRLTNRLLRRVTRSERNIILGRCETVELAVGAIVAESGRPFQHVYFPLDALISAVSAVERHPPLEVIMVGNEGMLGATLALGVNSAMLDAHVRNPGATLRLTAASFRDALANGPSLVRTVHRYLYFQKTQMAQNIMCNRFHELAPRLARWLLMTHDRLNSDRFFLIHKTLAELLGIRRSGVTIAAGHLQEMGFIHYTRGSITILDRSGLEQLACECYRISRGQYQRLFN